MRIRSLTADVAVAPQLTPADLTEAAAIGFRSIVNNRPDGEAEGQTTNAELETEAKRIGLSYQYIPVVSGQLSEREIAAFEEALTTMPKPLLAFCRSGTRSTTLWAFAAAIRRDPASILGCAAAAGHDLSSLRPALEARARANRLMTRPPRGEVS